MDRWTTTLCACVTLLLGGCADGSAGPCLHTFEDPVLTIARATDADSGEPIPQVRIRDLRVNGFRVEAEAVTRRAAFNVSVDDDAILCDAPCGFGSSEGVWSFRARSSAHDWSSFQVDAAYEVFQPGCPSSSAAGDSVAIVLHRP